MSLALRLEGVVVVVQGLKDRRVHCCGCWDGSGCGTGGVGGR